MFATIVGKTVATFQQVGRDWPKDQYDNFYRLYITEDLPLPEVRKRLEEEHGFIVTVKQCKSKIKEQGLTKYLKGPDMDKVVELQKKRKLEEDQNTVIPFGRLKINSKRIERYKKRKAKHESEMQSATAPCVGNYAPPSQGMPTEVKEPEDATIESISDTSKGTIYNLTKLTIIEDLGRLLKRICVLRPPNDITQALEAPRSDGTIDIQQMILVNKPQRHELEFLRSEWEKERELAWHHLSKGQFKDAEYHARITLVTQESCLGVLNVSTMGTINILSYIHGSQTNSSEVKTYEWMHQASSEIYGPRHPATLDSKRDLAWVYQARNMEEKARSLLREILTDLIRTPKESVENIKEHFIELSRATTDLAVLLCLQGRLAECDNLLGVLWSAVAYFTLKHKCSLRVASAMGRKLAGMGQRDDTAFLLTTCLQSAVTDTGYCWSSYLNVSSHRIVAGRATVGELLAAYEEHVLPLLAKTMAILRKFMGFGTALCEPILQGGGFRSFNAGELSSVIQQRDLQSFNDGRKLIRYEGYIAPEGSEVLKR